MKFETRVVNELGDLFRFLMHDKDAYQGPLWFRGQPDAQWNLEPKLLRADTPPELYLINRFKQSATYLLESRPNNEFDWLFLMQHYGKPTRLLDWSESPLVGLYFAINELTNVDGTLWVLAPCILNRRANYQPEWEFEIPSFDDGALSSYLPARLASERKSSLQPMAGIAVRNNPRMHAQQGVFTISHRENVKIDLVELAPEDDYLWKFSIPAERKEHIRLELELAGIALFQLFPELSSIEVR